MKKNNEPKIEPWETPEIIDFKHDLVLSRLNVLFSVEEIRLY